MKKELRHLCTLCRKKRFEKYLRRVKPSDKPESFTWICKDNCLDGRMNKVLLSFHQDRLSQLQEGLSRPDHRLSDVPGNKFILDACCGNRMFWFNKQHKNTLYADLKAEVAADVIQDFRNMKYKDKSFKLVIFDPPHLFKKQKGFSWVNEKYGVLDQDN